MNSSFQKQLERRFGVPTGKVYSTSDSGLQQFENVQTKLDQMWRFVKDTNPESSILPYAQSMYYQKRKKPLGGIPISLGGFHAIEDKKVQERNLLHSKLEYACIGEAGTESCFEELPQILGVEQGQSIDHSILESCYELRSATWWWLPGHGDSNIHCGHIKAKICENAESHPEKKVFGRYYKKSCLARDCPVCAEAWSSRRAEYAVLRFATYLKGSDWLQDLIQETKAQTSNLPRKAFHKLLNGAIETALRHERRRVIHWVLSPPTDTDFRKPVFQKLRNQAYRMAKSVGFKGGEPVFHPYRLHCRVCDVAIPEYHKECPSCGGTLFKWVPSPHFHFVGFGWTERTEELYASSGWVVKNLGVRESVFWTVQYLLSHAGVFKDQEPSFKPKIFNVTTWIGDLAYNKKICPPKLVVEKEVCPYCGSILMQMEDVELGRHPPPIDWEENQDFLFSLVSGG